MRTLPRKIRKLPETIAAINALIEYLAESQIVSSPTIKTERRTRGISLHATGTGTGGGQADNVWQ